MTTKTTAEGAEGGKKNAGSSSVEGEGSYSATRKYNADLEKALKKGNTTELAEKARKALEGPERNALEEAEKIGKSRRKD
jgi:hypothetical protein